MDRRAFIGTAAAIGLFAMLDAGVGRVAERSLAYHLFLSSGEPGRPLLVMVHGVSTHPATLIELAARPAAEHRTPLMAPDFHADELEGYQRLGDSELPLLAARALENALAEVAHRPGIPAGKVDLMGFSGGAQFVHRFALFFPQLVRRAVIAAPGWYTYLEGDEPYPYGTGASRARGGLEPNVAEFLKIPKLVAVGERDVERDRQLRTGRVDGQGRNRLERARRWVDHVNRLSSRAGLGERAALAVLPRTGHSVSQAMRQGGLAERMFEFLGDEPAATVPESSNGSE
jgi:pimeloyl-ACP methyl ester carboxylesterase